MQNSIWLDVVPYNIIKWPESLISGLHQNIGSISLFNKHCVAFVNSSQYHKKSRTLLILSQLNCGYRKSFLCPLFHYVIGQLWYIP